MRWSKEKKYRINWEYTVEHDYDSFTDCSSYGCSEEGICRCSTIENARVTEIPVAWVQEHKIVELWAKVIYPILYEHPDTAPNKESRITLALSKSDNWRQFIYSAGRIISHFLSLRKPDDFDVEVCGGYYGQEIEGVYLSDNIEFGLKSTMEGLLLDAECGDSNGAILRALKYEYDYLLDGWEDASFACGRMPLFAVHALNDKHLRKLNRKTVDEYKYIFENEGDAYSLSSRLAKASGTTVKKVLESIPIVLVDTNLRLVDGHHRYKAAKEYIESQSNPDPMVWVLVSDKEMPRGR